MEVTAGFSSGRKCQAVIIMGSPADLSHCEQIVGRCKALGITPILHVSSAHKVFFYEKALFYYINTEFPDDSGDSEYSNQIRRY